MHRVWLVIFGLSILYLLGTLGSLELAEATGAYISLKTTGLRLGIGFGVVLLSGSLGGAFR